jgi:hypothetical protein
MIAMNGPIEYFHWIKESQQCLPVVQKCVAYTFVL